MSERLKATNQVSNDEIIEDLTKEFGSSLITDENAEEFVINPSSSAEAFPTSSGDASKSTNVTGNSDIPHTDNFGEDNDDKADAFAFKTVDNNDTADSDADSITEGQLKDEEMDLTDDQKAERRIIAEELKMAGNEAFKSADYERSIEKYTEGLKICPLQFTQQRSVLYCNRGAGKMKLERYASAAKDCTKALKLDDKYMKAYIRRAQCYESTDKLDESLADYKKILELDPSHKEANLALIRLPPKIEEKNEKLKAEMLGKLKDLGNMILKPFGLSTDNFKMEQDPDSKGYKINFNQ